MAAFFTISQTSIKMVWLIIYYLLKGAYISFTGGKLRISQHPAQLLYFFVCHREIPASFIVH